MRITVEFICVDKMWLWELKSAFSMVELVRSVTPSSAASKNSPLYYFHAFLCPYKAYLAVWYAMLRLRTRCYRSEIYYFCADKPNTLMRLSTAVNSHHFTKISQRMMTDNSTVLRVQHIKTGWQLENSKTV